MSISFTKPTNPSVHALRVIARTVEVWRVAPPSPPSARETARRAPHGHVSLRVLRRRHAALVSSLRPAFAHSW